MECQCQIILTGSWSRIRCLHIWIRMGVSPRICLVPSRRRKLYKMSIGLSSMTRKQRRKSQQLREHSPQQPNIWGHQVPQASNSSKPLLLLTYSCSTSDKTVWNRLNLARCPNGRRLTTTMCMGKWNGHSPPLSIWCHAPPTQTYIRTQSSLRRTVPKASVQACIKANKVSPTCPPHSTSNRLATCFGHRSKLRLNC